jgi:hypothetical protein
MLQGGDMLLVQDMQIEGLAQVIDFNDIHGYSNELTNSCV